MLIALLAAGCMVIQDSLAVIKYQAAARNRGIIAAAADVVIWLVMVTSMTISTFTLHSGTLAQKAWVVGLVSAANIAGNLLGTYLGKRFVSDEAEEAQDDRLAKIEARLASIEANAPRSPDATH